MLHGTGLGCKEDKFMPEYNAEWSDFTDYCQRLLEDKQKNGVFPPFGRVGGNHDN